MNDKNCHFVLVFIFVDSHLKNFLKKLEQFIKKVKLMFVCLEPYYWKKGYAIHETNLEKVTQFF